ncbi:hypothetical protein [Microbacterium lacticum]|nr:hypothetical protein [Microbacterium lacticum]
MSRPVDTGIDREALESLAARALPEDAPGAWIRQAVAIILEATAEVER